MSQNTQYSKSNPPSYKEYIDDSVCELSLAIAIDFSGSNGDPRRSGTLHEIRNDGKLNDYEEAITAVASILSKLDEDEEYPVWGFGIRFGGEIQNCFQVGPDKEVKGLNGILEAYRGMFQKPLTMSGPTDLTGVINYAATSARNELKAAMKRNMIAYKILLILTDGSVSDLNKLMQCLAKSSSAPLSIVIVGVGKNEFSAMKFIDEFTVQDTPDICQFIEFETYKRNTKGLIRATLEEFPEQITSFFIEREIYPNSNFKEMDSLYPEDTDESTSEVGKGLKKLELKKLDVNHLAFKVQVAPGLSPGTHIVVQSPHTKKELNLIVPLGVLPGGTFVVNG